MINPNLMHYYSSPGYYIKLINFSIKYNIDLNSSAAKCKEFLKNCEKEVDLVKKLNTVETKGMSSPEIYHDWLEKQEKIRKRKRSARKKTRKSLK